MLILKELILASTNHMDFRQNDVAQDVLLQLQVYQSKMPALIEQGLMSDPEVNKWTLNHVLFFFYTY